ncbi:MAG TPA: hypothetical protein EYP98_20590, partial [Planctomycetes bacterium]|nr:hypothetical protein [Planctomycetota bacterium]
KLALNSSRCKRWFGIVVLSIVLLEVVLQIASYVTYLTYSRDQVATGAEGGATILCIGDSYTFGLGSSSPEETYPATLQRQLKKQRLAEPTVINAGWPGHNSRDLLQQLDAQLAAHSPDLVLVLVGINDTWSKPEHLELGEGTGSATGSNWAWRWRTGRLFAWAFGGSAPPVADAETAESASESAPQAGTGPPLQRAWGHVGAGNLRAAVVAFDEALERQPEDALTIHKGLAQTHSSLNQSDEARHSLQWIEGEHARAETQQTTEALVDALVAVGEHERAFEVVSAGVRAHGASHRLWWNLGEGHYRHWQLDAAEQAYDRCLLLSPPHESVWRASVMRACARTCYERDAGKSLKLVIRSLLLDGNLGLCIVAMKPARSRYSANLAKQCMAELGLAPAQQGAAQQLVTVMLSMTDVPQKDEAMCRIFDSHLRQIIERCDQAGAEVMLMTYPMPTPFIVDIVRALGKKTGATVVDVLRLFEITALSREDLFIPDGHCSGRGYRLMGEAAAAIVAKHLAR